MSKTSFFSSFKSTAPEYSKVPEGLHTFVIAQIVWGLDSRHNWDSSEKEDLPEYKDACDQIGLLLKSDKGFIPMRMNGCGYTRFDELTADQKKSGKFIDIDGFAVHADTMERDISDDRTEKARNIMLQLFRALNMPEGSDLNALDTAVEDQLPFQAKVTYENSSEYGEQVKVNGFKKVKGEQPETANPETPKASAKGKHKAQTLHEFE